MSESWNKEKHFTDKCIENMSKSQLNRKHPQKVKDKMSKSHIGIKSHKTPVVLLDKELNKLMNFDNIPNCAEYINMNKRTVYDAISKLSLVKHKYYILKEDDFDCNLIRLKEKLFMF